MFKRGDITFFCTLLLISLFTYSAEAQNETEVDTIIIMPLGDSMMNDGRSRGGLWNKLTEDGYLLDYVGSQTQNGIIPDPHHEGVGGATIQDVAAKINGLLEEFQPEYIVLMIGTNNVAGYYEVPGEESAAIHNDLVQQIFDNSPVEGIALLVSNIPPVTSDTLQNGPLAGEDRVDHVKAFNEVLKANMEARIEAGENLVFADVYTPMKDDTAKYLYDGVHPNSEGYEVIAQVWYEAFIELLEKNDQAGDTVSTSTGEIINPHGFELKQNYPNPFNPATTIEYNLAKAGYVNLSIYNVMGQKVATLVEEKQTVGNYQLRWDAAEMSSGVYYYRLNTAGEAFTRKMTLIK